MEQFEKIDRLAKTANVTYEDAKEALEQSNWDMIDAMLYLEKHGKTQKPEQTSYSTNYNDQPGYKAMDVNTINAANNSSRETFGDKIKKLFKKSHENHFLVERRGAKLIELPIWATVLIFLLTWKVSLVMMIVGLFFGCSYYFAGPANVEPANKVMSEVENAAETIKDKIKNEL